MRRKTDIALGRIVPVGLSVHGPRADLALDGQSESGSISDGRFLLTQGDCILLLIKLNIDLKHEISNIIIY